MRTPRKRRQSRQRHPNHTPAWRARLNEGREALVVGRDDLIAMKRARGRSHDRSDIVELTSARRRAQQQARTRVAITVPLKPGVEDRTSQARRR